MAEPSIRPLLNSAEIGICAGFMAASEPWITLGRGLEACKQLLSDRERERYVAEVKGRIAGVIVLSMCGAFVGYVQTVCVAPEFRGCGIGSFLIRYAEDRTFRVSPNVFICVSSFNKKAQRFYERLGYEVVGEMRGYIVSGQSEILLRKTIGPIDNFKAKEDNP